MKLKPREDICQTHMELRSWKALLAALNWEFRPLNPLLTSHWMEVAPGRRCDLGRDNFLRQGNPNRGLTAEGHLLVTLQAARKGSLGKWRTRALQGLPHILIPALQITMEAERSSRT